MPSRKRIPPVRRVSAFAALVVGFGHLGCFSTERNAHANEDVREQAEMSTSSVDSRNTADPLSTNVPSVGAPSALSSLPGCSHSVVVERCGGGFCRVPSGCFIMGAPRDEFGAGRFSYVQVHVTISREFEVSQTEITYAQWVAEGFEPPDRDVLGAAGDCREPNCPVSNVNLFDAISFANAYSMSRSLSPCYDLSGCVGRLGAGPRCRVRSTDQRYVCEQQQDPLDCETIRVNAETPYDCEGYRLPTEAEWEYSARAGAVTALWNGGLEPTTPGSGCIGDPTLDSIAWYCANSGLRAHGVAEKAKNPWGLYDVLGNVREWTTDVFNGLGYGQGPLIDPVGSFIVDGSDLMPEVVESGSAARAHGFVVRGGAHMLPSHVTTVNDRSGNRVPESGDTSIGFRLVRSLRD